jgi:hypothetical protein
MNRKELENLIREILQQEQWKVVGGSRRYTPSRIEKWKKLVAAEPFPDADGDGVDDRDETTDDEEEYARRMAARDALKAKYLEEEIDDAQAEKMIDLLDEMVELLRDLDISIDTVSALISRSSAAEIGWMQNLIGRYGNFEKVRGGAKEDNINESEKKRTNEKKRKS